MNNRIISLAAVLTGVAIIAASTSAAQAQHGHDHHFHGGHHHYDHGWNGVAPIRHPGFHDDSYCTDYDNGPSVADDFFTSDADAPESPTAEFGSFSHVEELVAQLEAEVNQLCLDLHFNYSHNPGFKETYREAYALLQAIKVVHENEHEGNREAIVQSVQQLDGLLHHVRGDVQEWSRHQRRQIGPGGINTKLNMIEASLQSLMFDVGVEPQQHENEELEGPPANGEAAPSPADDGPPAPGFDVRNSRPTTNNIEPPNGNLAPQSPELEDGGPAFDDGGPIESPQESAPMP